MERIMSEASHNLLLSSLTTYYQRRPQHRRILFDVVEGLSPVSLRVIDWFVTHFARNHQVFYWINENTDEIVEKYPEKGGAHLRKFHLYLDYRAQLKSYTKLYFDCFRRHERITFVLETDPLKKMETTVGQLNFFRWALQNHVLEYIANHLEEIEDYMAIYQKTMKKGTASASHVTGSVVKSSSNSVVRAPCYLRFD